MDCMYSAFPDTWSALRWAYCSHNNHTGGGGGELSVATAGLGAANSCQMALPSTTQRPLVPWGQHASQPQWGHLILGVGRSQEASTG